jgi:hypothetical protein
VAIAQCFFEFAANLKDFVGIRQGQMSGFGQFQPPPGAPEQRPPQFFFQLGDLSGEGLRREMQLFGTAHHAARLGHRMEVMQLTVIEHDDPILRK